MGKSIWYISKYASSPNEDVGRQRMFDFAKHFSTKGHQVTLISSRSNSAHHINKQSELSSSTKYDELEYVQLKGPEINLGFSLKRIWSWIIFEFNLRRYFKKQKNFPDIVIVSSLSLLTTINAIYLKKKHGTRFILEIRDIWPLSLIELSSLKASNPLVKILAYLEKRAYKNADSIIGSMPNLQEHVVNTLATKKQVDCIPMSFHKNSFNKRNELELPLQKKIPKNNFVIGYAGTIGNANAMEALLESATFLESYPITIVILGDGPLRFEYESKYKSKNIIFLGSTDKSRVQHFLSYCNVLVNTWHNSKIYNYGVSPNKWIDYMFAAKPILVSYNGFQSIINEANCGEFIEAGNAKKLAEKIIEYYKKPQSELEEMGKRGKEYLLAELDHEKIANKFLDIVIGNKEAKGTAI